MPTTTPSGFEDAAQEIAGLACALSCCFGWKKIPDGDVASQKEVLHPPKALEMVV
jgi:hypothetical protein